MKVLTGAQLRDAARAQHVPLRHRAFKCPLCGTVQSAHDFIQAGAGGTFDEVSKHLGTACIGRFTGAGAPRRVPDGKPCNWLLGGLLQLHTMVVVDEDGRHWPIFEPASPEEAQAHAVSNRRQNDGAAQAKSSYNLEQFFQEAAELNLTAADLAAALADRPEFADCKGPTARATSPPQ